MKLTLLQHLSGDKVYAVGEEIELDEKTALRFILKGIAKAKTVKAHNDLMAKAEKIEKEANEKEMKILAMAKEKELRSEADALLDELDKVVSSLASIDPEYPERFLTVVASKFGSKDAPGKSEDENKEKEAK